VCNLAYTLIVDSIRRDNDLAQLAAVLAAAAGGQLETETYAQAKGRFDEWLASPVKVGTAEDAELRAALGLPPE
jgi:hypothetical protein